VESGKAADEAVLKKVHKNNQKFQTFLFYKKEEENEIS
jgi:hypothetical protein